MQVASWSQTLFWGFHEQWHFLHPLPAVNQPNEGFLLLGPCAGVDGTTRVQLVFASSVNKSVFFFISVEINTHLKLPDAKASTGELIVTFVNLLCL